MGIFSRLNDIVNSNLNTMLDRAEDPEKIIRLVVQEMENTLVEIRSDAARSIADKKKQLRRIDRLEAEIDEWERKATLAISKDREDLARAALVEKHGLEKIVTWLRQDQEELEEQLGQLNIDTSRLQEKLDEARARQKSLLMKHGTISNRLRTREKLHDKKIDDAFSSFEKLENKLDKLEGQVESYDIGRSSSLETSFAELEVSEQVDEELSKLRKANGQD